MVGMRKHATRTTRKAEIMLLMARRVYIVGFAGLCHTQIGRVREVALKPLMSGDEVEAAGGA